jgi:predicted negative regulator of RcsB-dependent stress response
MKNKTLLTVGALAVLGVLAYKYFNKDKSKGTGYSNASGKYSKLNSVTNCTICQGASGGYWSQNGACREGDKCRR